MSDDERYSTEEEEEEEIKPQQAPPQASEAELAMEEKMRKKKEEEEAMWKEYMEQRKIQRQKEEDELRKLKERQAKRKTQRLDQEKKMMEMIKRQEETRIREMEEKKQREAEAKRKRLEEAEKKRQAMQEAMQRQKIQEPVKRNFVIQKKEGEVGPGAALGHSGFDKFTNVMHARGEMGKTKEQLEEDKKICLQYRVKPLELEGLKIEELRQKAMELWARISSLESDKYDLEERQKRQDYDPKIQVASKYERRIDRRTYSDKRELFDGGLESCYDAELEKQWEEKMATFKDRGPPKLPKWDPSIPRNKEVGARRHEEEEDEDIELHMPSIPEPTGAKPADDDEEDEDEDDEDE
ncbi:uncharacterized protein LOC143225342 isoform X2 [Tachypleus tridentatus]|uniref:uncharacterized protein LOC143225342 isoform X2 n=1 Tax=Tachypleus tridentatus TaxID=6853 RepID=UPI003FD501C6